MKKTEDFVAALNRKPFFILIEERMNAARQNLCLIGVFYGMKCNFRTRKMEVAG